MILAEILKDDFVDVKEVYKIAERYGMKKADVKAEKYKLGVKTIQVTSASGESLWLWFNPERIWEKYHVRENS